MAKPSSLVSAAVAGTTLITAWRSYQRAPGKVRRISALFSVFAAVAAVYSVIKNIREDGATLV